MVRRPSNRMASSTASGVSRNEKADQLTGLSMVIGENPNQITSNTTNREKITPGRKKQRVRINEIQKLVVMPS